MNKYSKYLLLKSAMENLFGKEAWYALKESNSVPTWRKYTEKALKALKLSINNSIEVCDEEWRNDINSTIEKGLSLTKMAKEIDELISILAGTLIHTSFLQVGFMPHRSGCSESPSLRKENWQLNLYRSAIYIQTQEQKENHFWSQQQNEIGFEKQMEWRAKHRKSKSNLPYSEWCSINKKA